MECQRHLFRLDEGHHYLNCAFLSPLLKSVEEAGRRGIRAKSHPWEVTPETFFRESDRLRELFARLVGIDDPKQVAIMPAVSYGVSSVVKNLPRNGRSKIVVNGEQFPSNVYPWQRFARETGRELHAVDPPGEGSGRAEEWNRRLLEAIDRDTLVVSLAPLHWTDGTLFDLEKVGERCRETGSWFVVDGTQSVGALPFDVGKIRPDALFCSGYKWLLGPYSIALGFMGERLLEGVPLEEGWINRKNSEDFAGLVDYVSDYQPGAIRYDVGERSNFILVPMMIRALEQLIEWEPARIQRYCRRLGRPLAETLPEHGYRLEEPSRRAHHLFGLRMPSTVSKESLQKKLSDRNVHVSIRGSDLRVSPNVYNSERDVEALMEVLTG